MTLFDPSDEPSPDAILMAAPLGLLQDAAEAFAAANRTLAQVCLFLPNYEYWSRDAVHPLAQEIAEQQFVTMRPDLVRHCHKTMFCWTMPTGHVVTLLVRVLDSKGGFCLSTSRSSQQWRDGQLAFDFANTQLPLVVGARMISGRFDNSNIRLIRPGKFNIQLPYEADTTTMTSDLLQPRVISASARNSDTSRSGTHE